ncbi:ABC transporter substrate-binding protein [Teichococcus oryzae]|uniref:ABC transporter substrate-binding protein n=1 Tax=Teichococcus oryzae TaxID=1608942 RepID=A0A5B2TFC9_9PROT|nr:ABC transporter substrate-binding protein [Pseudoroseomonas oryzae]KAA2212879.1 ABC transporter substrate-binding protein [Pseudoroseomonas oryzae]
MRRRDFLGAAAASAATLPLPAFAQPERARVMTFIPHANLASLDPIWTTALVTSNHGYYVFDTLYGVDGRLRPHPQMAEGHTVSDDGRTWLIRLREGLRFHDGEPVRAADCVASLRRWAARDTFGRTLAGAVEAWESADDRTLRIRLKRPFPLLVDAIAKPASTVPFIMPERLAATDPNTQVSEMVGSGPYRFVAGEHASGSRVVYEKFAGYRPRQEAPDWTMGGKVTHFDRIVWQIVPDPATAAAALQSGEVDWVDQVLPDLVPVLRRNRNIAVGNGNPAGHFAILRFNHTQAPFNNQKLRQVVLRAVNQADYMATVTANDEAAYKICHSFFPCGTPYGTPPAPDPMATRPSMDELRRLVRESGYAGEKIVILSPSDFATVAPFGQVTHALFRELGLNAELVETDWGALIQRRNSNRGPAESGGWSVFQIWWTGETLVNPAMNAIMRGQGAGGYAGWYESARMEALNERWLNETTEAGRAAVAAQMQALAFEEVPSVPIGQFSIHTAYRRTLAGMVEGPAPFPWGVRRA